MKFKFFITYLLFVLGSITFAQNFSQMLVNGGKSGNLTYLTKRANDFVSASELSEIIGRPYSTDNKNKIEINSGNSKIKFTAQNQFLIVSSNKYSGPQIFQLPISTMLVNNQIYIPIQYSIHYLNDFLDVNLSYDQFSKTLNIENNNLNKNEFVEDLSDYNSEAINSFDLFGLEIEKKFNGTQITFKSNKKIHRHTKSIVNNKLLVTISGITIFPQIDKNTLVDGLVKNVEIKKITDLTTQFEFALNKGYTNADSFIDQETNDLIISVQNETYKRKEIDFEKEAEKWLFDVIVIDAGHGGKDPGAIGVTGTREKDVNLGIAKKLGNLIERKMPDVKIIYTRKDDRFVELFKRGKIANENNGKLFISIHCNSLPKKRSSIRGYETYLLRPGRTDEAIRIAEAENKVIEYEDNPNLYQELTDENFILVSMAHSANMRYAEKFSDILNQEMLKNGTIPSRGIKQAGFYVLVGASMPGILFESGYLSNRKDEAYLKSRKGQIEIARRMFYSIQTYKKYYEEMMQHEL